jgi:hypothetical protein
MRSSSTATMVRLIVLSEMIIGNPLGPWPAASTRDKYFVA